VEAVVSEDKIRTPNTLTMKWVIFFFPALLPVAGWAQKAIGKPNQFAQVDARSMQLPDSVATSVEKLGHYFNDHFQTPTDKTRAIFVWIANNIQYDVANMFAINFYEDAGEKIAKPLRTKKGICENYAALFTAICVQAGIKSVVVEGYTKQRGFVDYIPHAWNATLVDGAWYLFDPTWGSGYIDNGKFVRKMNNDYFKATPEAFIKSHMPFDYLWEFLYYPVTNQEFYEGKTVQDKSKPYFNYPDSIRAYEVLGPEGKEGAEAVRVEKNGVRNSLIFDRLRHLKVDLENYRRQAETDRQNFVVNSYNDALRNYNAGIKQFNVFINYRNDQFKPLRPDAEIQQMIDSADHEVQTAKTKAGAIITTDADARVLPSLQSMKAAIDDLSTHVKEQQDWLTKYFSKSKMGRKSMFYKYTWFGVPLN
jgi:hypothetical protein